MESTIANTKHNLLSLTEVITENATNKLILTEDDLYRYGVWNNYHRLREQLYRANERNDCLLIQGSAFVVNKKAFLMIGVGGIDFLDSLAQLDEVDGLIGNGNALFVSRDFQSVYSAHSTEDLIKCYELEGSNTKAKFLESASLAPAIFLLRSFRTPYEYEKAKLKANTILFEESNTFARKPIRYASRLRGRLREKFLATARVVHCARRPTLTAKECLFDSHSKIRSAIEHFNGWFVLMYTLWSQKMCDAIGMRNTRKLSNNYYNPTDPITPYIVKSAEIFLEK